MISPSKTRILDAAEDLFANKGYGATSIVDIADAVGIRGPAIYKHYSSKTDVYNAVVDRLFAPMQAHMELSVPLAEGQSFELLEKLVKHHIDHPNISRIIQQATLSSGEHLEKLVDDWYRPFFSVSALYKELTESNNSSRSTIVFSGLGIFVSFL